VVLAERRLTGRFETIDPNGRLMLRMADGEQEVVTAGDVFPLSTSEKPVSASARAEPVCLESKENERGKAPAIPARKV
jgi:hypothetical protein